MSTTPSEPASAPLDCAIVGGGPAGLAAALALAHAGCETAVIGPPHRPLGDKPDSRTAALFNGSIELLKRLGAWDELAPLSEPLAGIRIVDDTGGLFRAPEVLFTPAEVGLDNFGWNVSNEPLVAALRSAAVRSPAIRLIDTPAVTALETRPDRVRLTVAGTGTVEARLVVGADGRRSICRAAAGIETSSWTYEQSAITCLFTHSRPHNGISTEFHRPAGPCTVVPMPGLASSLVWVERPEVADGLARLDDAGFRARLAERLQGLLGDIATLGPRGLFPLSGLTANAFGRNRVALVGEAGHVIPPIGAQGLNLGLRDAAMLADCVEDARQQGADIGAPAVLSAYERSRRADVTSRIWTVDLLNRSLTSSLPPVQLLRGLGIHALKAIGPLRRLVVNEGLQPSYAVPRLMRA